MLMDISSEIIHSLLPLFMVTTLGASVIFIGLIEGLAEATALFIKVFSGAISDYLGKRKGLAVLGYGLGALSKPLFAIASSSGMILGARLIDRVGKGIRERRAMRWLLTLRRRNCAARPLGCVSRWTPSAHFSGRCWP
jgi:sorbitol-specific phosphotransferase system component IIC